MTDQLAVEKYIKSQPAGVQPLLHAARGAILRRAPMLKETMKWGYPCYTNPKTNALVLSLYTLSGAVQINFFHGSTLKDPAKLLQTTMPNAAGRHAALKDLMDAHKPELHALIKQAAEQP